MALTGDFVTGQNLPFQRMRALLGESGGGVQEGVVGATDLKVAQRGAGANMSVDVPAGAAWVQVDTGTRNGLAHVYNDATANLTIAASNATNPRVDSVTLRYNDTSIPTGSGNTPTLEVLTGTATAGAQITNTAGANYRAGAATLGNDRLLLADILVPATSTSVTTANIVDRRPWARGAFVRLIRASTSLTTSASTLTAMDTTNLQARVECTGNPVRVTLTGFFQHSVAATNALFGFLVDGAQLEGTFQQSAVGAGLNNMLNASVVLLPTAGSHTIAAGFATAAATLTVLATAATPLYFTIEEIIRPNASNT